MPILRPTVSSSPNWNNPGNAIDGNENTSATVSTNMFNSTSRGLTLDFDFSSITGIISTMTLCVKAKAGKNTITMVVYANGDSNNRVIYEKPNTSTATLYTADMSNYISSLSNITLYSNNSNFSGNTLEVFEVYIQYELKVLENYTVRFLDWNGNVLKTEIVVEGNSATPPSNPSRDGYVFDKWDKSYTNINANTDITAVYKKLYTVRFLDWNGNELSSQSVAEGNSATAPSDPTRTGYTFTGWNPSDFSNITGDLTVTAQYTINTYTVTFKDHDGKTLKIQTVNYGSDATAPSDPSREGYTFNGWDKSFSNITGDLTITAQYTINTYTVIFVDHDGKTLKTQTVNYGSSAIPPSNPSREGYTFTRWDTDFSSVKSNLTITAIYTINTYTVTFVDYDGKTLKTQTVTHGSPATAPSNPSRTGYTFTGWNPADFTNITNNLTVTAQYTINTYTVAFKDWNGTTLKTQSVEYGSGATAPSNPSREGYTFTGWDPSDFSNVKSDLIVTAQYTINTYTVIFKDYDGTILKEEQIVEYGSDAIPPNNPTREGYTFTGWDKGFSNVTSNLVITATYVENAASINKILIGDTTTDNLYVGDSNVIAVYIGDFLVFGIDISE